MHNVHLSYKRYICARCALLLINQVVKLLLLGLLIYTLKMIKDTQIKRGQFIYDNNELSLLTKNYLVQLVGVEDPIKGILKAPQRLNTKDIHWLVGFTDGHGCFTTYREKKYNNNWRHAYSIGLQLKDIRLLYKIKELLNCGIVKLHKNVAYFVIKKNLHLLSIIIPIFDSFPLLTENKRIRYINFRKSLINKIINQVDKQSTKQLKNKEIILAKELLNNTDFNLFYNISIEDLFIIMQKNLSYLYYFENWIVGFTEAEGSFFLVNSYNDNSFLRAEYNLYLKDNIFLLSKIKEKLKLTRDVQLKTNSINQFYILATSVKTIQNVINFFFNPSIVQFKGIKCLQFQLWLKGIKKIDIYRSIVIPNKHPYN